MAAAETVWPLVVHAALVLAEGCISPMLKRIAKMPFGIFLRTMMTMRHRSVTQLISSFDPTRKKAFSTYYLLLTTY